MADSDELSNSKLKSYVSITSSVSDMILAPASMPIISSSNKSLFSSKSSLRYCLCHPYNRERLRLDLSLHTMHPVNRYHRYIRHNTAYQYGGAIFPSRYLILCQQRLDT